MTKEIILPINNGNFKLIFFNKEGEVVESTQVCIEYNLFTEEDGLCLTVRLVSPMVLLDLSFFTKIAKVQLAFLDTNDEFLSAYEFDIKQYAWEIEGKKGMQGVLSWIVNLKMPNKAKIVIKEDGNKQ